MQHHPGPPLPYALVAGVLPVRGHWLVVGARLQAITLAPEEPCVLSSFGEVLDTKPSYSVIALYSPVGLLDAPEKGGRTCDRAARTLLGPRRGASVRSMPSRQALGSAKGAEDERLDAVTATLLPRYREVAGEMAPYRQRTVYETHPELGFFELNGDRPLLFAKRYRAGYDERRQLLEAKIPGIEVVLDAELPDVRAAQLLDAAACLWTARRIVARAVVRLPEDPEWDSEGLRMELLR